MPYFKKDKSVLFQGISDYWLRFFADDFVLKGLSAGNQYLAGQIYFDLLTAGLRNKIDDMPIFDRNRWQLLILSADQLDIDSYIELDEEGNEHQFFLLPTNVAKFKYIYNRIFAASRILEDTFDFEIIDTGVNQPKKLRFADGINVFQFENVAKREREVDGAVITELAFWVPNTTINDQWLYKDYGVLVDERNNRETSEGYRSFIYGLFNYFMKGPTLQRMESALNIINDVPVARNDGEVVESINLSTKTIVTNLEIYTLPPQASIRVKVGETLQAFQPLSDDFQVGDYISHPEWWGGIYLNPDAVQSRATLIYDADYEYDEPVGPFVYKEPPPGNDTFITTLGPYPYGYDTTDAFSSKIGDPFQKHLFYKFDQLLKHHNFFIRYNAYYEVTRDIELLDAVLRGGRLAYTNYTLIPYIGLPIDFVNVSDYITVIRTVPMFDNFMNVCNHNARPIEHISGATYNERGQLTHADYENTDNATLVYNHTLARWSFSDIAQHGINRILVYRDETQFQRDSRPGYLQEALIPSVSDKRLSGIHTNSPFMKAEFGYAYYLSFTLQEQTFNTGDVFPLLHQPYYDKDDATNDWVGWRLVITKKVILGNPTIVFELRVRYTDGSTTVVDYKYDPAIVSAQYTGNPLYNRQCGLVVYCDPTLPGGYTGLTSARRIIMYLNGEPLELDGTDGVDNIVPYNGTENYYTSMAATSPTRSSLYVGKYLEFDTDEAVEYAFTGVIHDYKFINFLGRGGGEFGGSSVSNRNDIFVRNGWFKKPSTLRRLSQSRINTSVKREIYHPNNERAVSNYFINFKHPIIEEIYDGKFDVNPWLHRHLTFVDTTSIDGYTVYTEDNPNKINSMYGDSVYSPTSTREGPFSQFWGIYPINTPGDIEVYQLYFGGGQIQSLLLNTYMGYSFIDISVVDLHPEYLPDTDETAVKKVFESKNWTVRMESTINRFGGYVGPASAWSDPFDKDVSTLLFDLECSTGSFIRVWETRRVAAVSLTPTTPTGFDNPSVSQTIATYVIELKREAEPTELIEVRNDNGDWVTITPSNGSNILTLSYESQGKIRFTVANGHADVPTLVGYAANPIFEKHNSDLMVVDYHFSGDNHPGKYGYFETSRVAAGGAISPTLVDLAEDYYVDIAHPGYTTDLVVYYAPPENNIVNEWGHGAIGDYPAIVRTGEDLSLKSRSGFRRNILSFELYSTEFKAWDMLSNKHTIAYNDQYAYYDCGPEYYERLVITAIAGTPISESLFLEYVFDENKDPTGDQTVALGDLITTPTLAQLTIVNEIPLEEFNLLSTPALNTQVLVDSTSIELENLLFAPDLTPQSLQTTESSGQDVVIDMSLDYSVVVGEELEGAIAILPLNQNVFVQSEVGAILVVEYVGEYSDMFELVLEYKQDADPIGIIDYEFLNVAPNEVDVVQYLFEDEVTF